jgi:hypothetical protein
MRPTTTHVVAEEHENEAGVNAIGVISQLFAVVVADVVVAVIAVVDFEGVATAEPVAVATNATHEVVQYSEASEVQVGGVVTTLHLAPASRVSRNVTTCWGDVVAT